VGFSRLLLYFVTGLCKRTLIWYAGFMTPNSGANPSALMELLADDVVWHVPGRNLLSRDYHGKAEVAGFWAKARELSGGTVRTELLEVLGGNHFAVALVRVFAEREGKSLGGQFQAFTYRIEGGKVAEFWFMVEDRYAVDAFWT
jgi:ketosteroid isomerase-like protein